MVETRNANDLTGCRFSLYKNLTVSVFGKIDTSVNNAGYGQGKRSWLNGILSGKENHRRIRPYELAIMTG